MTDNEIFQKASPEEERVMIAKDVIERINLKNLIATTGYIVQQNETFRNAEGKLEVVQLIPHTGDVREWINTPGKVCKVCAKGAMFMSMLGIEDDFDFETLRSANANINTIHSLEHQRLPKYFSPKQLNLIEVAFEGTQYLYSVSMSDEEDTLAKNFHSRYAKTNDRLIAIAENIIQNNGEFIP